MGSLSIQKSEEVFRSFIFIYYWDYGGQSVINDQNVALSAYKSFYICFVDSLQRGMIITNVIISLLRA